MAKKKILLVGEFGNREDWKEELLEDSNGNDYDFQEAPTMMDAVALLRANAEGWHSLLVQDNVVILDPATVKPEIPAEFEAVRKHLLKRGETLITYARKQELIESTTPAYLVSVSPEAHTNIPEEVTGLLNGEQNIADQMRANLRGGKGKTTGPRELGK